MSATTCVDCGVETQPLRSDGTADFERWDLYMVRREVWAAAGDVAGSLCRLCLARRLGRSLVDVDYLARPVLWTAGGVSFECVPEYVAWVAAGETGPLP
jgi:hypothetical protein